MSRAAILIAVALAVAVALLLGVVAIDLRTRQIDAQGIADFRQENLLWNAMQLQSETIRYAEALSAFRLAPTDEAAGEAVVRFDVLWSRATLFTQGTTARRLAELDTDGVAPAILGLLEKHEALGSDPRRGSDSEFDLLLAKLRALQRAMQRYNARVLDFEERRMAAVQNAIIESGRAATLKIVVAMAATAAMLLAAWALAMANRRRLEEQRNRTAEAEAAAALRSRFLTMISHELRTPMNGVLGMLALVEHRTTEPMHRAAVSVARRSAMEMLGLIEDILDISELETGASVLHLETVTACDVAEDVRAMLERRLGDVAHGFRIVSTGEPHMRVLVSKACLCKAFGHMALFYLHRLGVQRACLTIEVRPGEIRACLASDEPPATRWNPDVFIGPLIGVDSANIPADAVGAAVARGHTRRLGGRGMAHVDAAGAITLNVVIPAAGQAEAADAKARAAAHERAAARSAAGFARTG